MQISWVNAAALIGLGLIALPIAIHLFVRQQTRTMLYPSLRFLRETALAAFRRRRIEDAILLACRVGIIAVAALAIAGPIVQTPGRTSGYAQRVARAHVRVDATPVDVSAISDGAFRFSSFSRAMVADAIRDALRWLEQQPPAGREIVFTGVFARGSIDAADLIAIPNPIGLRFVAVDADPPITSATVPILTSRGNALVLTERNVHLDADSTRVVDGAVTTVPAGLIRVVAAPNDTARADAALRTALEEGIRWTTADQRVVVVWDGGTPPTPATDLEIIRMAVPASASKAGDAIRYAIEAATPVGLDEPHLIARGQLDAWTRSPGPPSPTALPADEGDRRWLWALALLLLAVEQWLRRAATRKSVVQPEARVA